jgi:anion-transporting  ArsA/GET3 family ATPase
VLDRRLLFVTGKGGVGKTAVTGAIGVLAARSGLRTLLCETDGSGRLATLLETGPLTFDAREVQPSLSALTVDTESSLREYLSLQLRVPLIARLGPFARTLDFVANAAPGVREILTIGKLGWEVRESNYDLVVVDAAATGHVISQLRAPRSMNELLGAGLVRDQTDWLIELLSDHAITGVVLVTTPEETPVAESLELMGRLDDPDVDVDLALVVVNRVLPELFGRDEEEVFDRLAASDGVDALEQVAGAGVATVIDAARLAVGLRRAGSVHLATLREGLPAATAMAYLPELFARAEGVRSVRQLADHLADEL